MKMTQDEIFKSIREERQRQDAKWGVQNHDSVTWITILTEEVGEAARDALAIKFGSKQHGNMADPVARFQVEMVQIAAVTVAAIEAMDVPPR